MPQIEIDTPTSGSPVTPICDTQHCYVEVTGWISGSMTATVTISNGTYTSPPVPIPRRIGDWVVYVPIQGFTKGDDYTATAVATGSLGATASDESDGIGIPPFDPPKDDPYPFRLTKRDVARFPTTSPTKPTPPADATAAFVLLHAKIGKDRKRRIVSGKYVASKDGKWPDLLFKPLPKADTRFVNTVIFLKDNMDVISSESFKVK